MRRKTLFIIGGLLLASIVAVSVGPGIVESRLNLVGSRPLKAVTPAAAALHQRMPIADMHADTLLWGRDPLVRAGRGHVDLPRLEAGHVALQVFSSVTKSPRGLNYHANAADSDQITLLSILELAPPRAWSSLNERSLWQASRLERAERASDGRLRIVRTGADVKRLLADRSAGQQVTGAMLSIEGLHDLDGDLANVERLYGAGFRMAGLTHFFDNDVAGSMHGLKKGGLTPFGQRVLAEMERLHMIVDVAHASASTIDDVLALATRPVVSSHGGVQATCKTERNLTDDQLRRIAAKGGLVGIGYWVGAVCSDDPAAIASAIVHVRDLVGIDHVALGSDYDGATGMPFDVSQLAQVTNALFARLPANEVEKVMGGNLFRFLERQLPAQ